MIRTGDGTARWLVLVRHEHKDGGYFWSGARWVNGADPAEALSNWLAENPAFAAAKYAVLDWETARLFTNVASVMEDSSGAVV